MKSYSHVSATDLVRLCAETNDGYAWREFVARFERPIRLSVLRVANATGKHSSQIVDDLVQETYLKLCAENCGKLRAFTEQHPEAVVGYIKTTALNVARDHFKSARTQKRGEGTTDQWIEGVEPMAKGGQLCGAKAVEREVLLQEINRFLEACTTGPEQERDRLIFWLYYQQGITAKGIAELPTIRLTEKGVEAVIFRLTREIRAQLVRAAGPTQPRGANEKGFLGAESF